MSALTKDQLSRLQDDVQLELQRREWAEPDDTVMAEYVCVLLANGNPRDRVKSEMEDLVGADFEDSFLDWLFISRDALAQPAPTVAAAAAPETAPAPEATSGRPNSDGPGAGSRMFASAVEGTKRKADPIPEEQNKRRLPDAPLGASSAPSGPRAMQGHAPHGGRTLADRLGPRGGPAQRGGFNVRGAANGGRPGQFPGGPMAGAFRPQFQQQQQQQQQGQQFGFMPGQQEMMMQMMAMQANMAQMAEQMAMMAEEKAQGPRAVRPPRTTPVKVPSGTKLGGHAVSAIQPKSGSLGPIPDKPSSTALCKFGVGCSNARCTYSHPSPVADEKTGMVLSEEACEAGKNCKDPECIKSHVSPAAVHGETAGPSRMLCKYQNCTNPTCQFRHEDADGNFIPPPAQTKTPNRVSLPATSDSSNEVVMKPSLDVALDNTSTARPCRYAERCTRADCKFSHPASRPAPRGGPAKRGGAPSSSRDSIAGEMRKSTKFGAPSAALNPAAGEFKPAGAAEVDAELQVTL